MASIQSSISTNYRTTFYLTAENKALLDQIPRGKKTVVVNKALSLLLKKMLKEKDNQRFLEMIQEIKPVKTHISSEEMVRELRNG